MNKVLIFMMITLVALIGILIYVWYYNSKNIPVKTVTAIPNAWSSNKDLSTCAVYIFRPQNINGIWITQPNLRAIDDSTPSVPPAKCFYSNQLVAKKVSHTCTNRLNSDTGLSNCYLQDGGIAKYGEVEEFYVQCQQYSSCTAILASVSFSNQKSCDNLVRKCLSYNLVLTDCNPSADLMITVFYDVDGYTSEKATNTVSFQRYSTDRPYLSYDPSRNTLIWSEEKYLWKIETKNNITRLKNDYGYITSTNGTNIIVSDALSNNLWQNFQYINLELYNIILKSSNCPCNGCFEVVPL